MERLPWITKELLSKELLGKSFEEQKKIIRRAFQENNIKFKQGIKDKKMLSVEIDKCIIETFEDGIKLIKKENQENLNSDC